MQDTGIYSHPPSVPFGKALEGEGAVQLNMQMPGGSAMLLLEPLRKRRVHPAQGRACMLMP